MSIISELFLFENTDYAHLEKKYAILSEAVIKKFKGGEEILSLDSEALGIFVISSGNATILSGTTGHKAVLRNLKAGDTFGAASLFDSSELHKTSVISLGECEVVLLPKILILDIIKKESDVAFNYIRFLAGRVAFLNKKISAFTAGTAEQKLAIYLSGLDFSDGAFLLDISYTSLAAMLGIGRASLYRALDLFENEGVIRRNGKMIYLENDSFLAKYI